MSLVPTQYALVHKHSRSGKVYKAWSSMMQRCTQPDHRSYKDYGGRGIKVHPRWWNFDYFALDMGIPDVDMQLERMDNNKGYSPDNCKWATRKEQARNRRSTRNLTLEGRTMCAREWAAELGLPESTIYNRIRRGWDDKRVLTTPKRTYHG